MTASPIRWDERHGGYWSVGGVEHRQERGSLLDPLGPAASNHAHAEQLVDLAERAEEDSRADR